MSTGWLYHMLGVTGYQIFDAEYHSGVGLFVNVGVPDGKLRCSGCGSADVIRRGAAMRGLRTLPLGKQWIFIVLHTPRLECRACGVIRRHRVGFAEERVGYTKVFERYVLDLLRVATSWDVARHLGISWGTVKEIQKAHLQKHYGRPDLSGVQRIAMDELSVGKDHKFVTIVLDLDTGAVLFTATGKDSGALRPFWQRLRKARAKIQAVAMDMSPAYWCAVKTNLPEAAIVYDRFHVMKLYNEKLSDLRRELFHEITTKQGRQALKGIRWLLLKNPENLKTERHGRNRSETERLEQALKINEPLAMAYYLKEDLRQFWMQPDKCAADAWLNAWIVKASESGVRILQSFAKTLAGHRSGLLAWYDHNISTGPLEGVNNKIRAMQRMAYGFRDHEFFRLKIYALHEAKFKLVG